MYLVITPSLGTQCVDKEHFKKTRIERVRARADNSKKKQRNSAEPLKSYALINSIIIRVKVFKSILKELRTKRIVDGDNLQRYETQSGVHLPPTIPRKTNGKAPR